MPKYAIPSLPETWKQVALDVDTHPKHPETIGLFGHQQKLVGGFNHLEKYESQWEGWHPIYHGKLKMFETTNQKKVNYMMFTTLSNRWSFSQLAALNSAYIYIHTPDVPIERSQGGGVSIAFPVATHLRAIRCISTQAGHVPAMLWGVDKSTWRLSVSWKLRTSFDLHRLLKVHLWFMTCFLVFHSWCPYLGFLYGWEYWSTNSRYIYHHLFMSFHVEAFLFSDSITWKQPTQGKKTIEIQKWCHEAWTV